jgi:hypothetical protein
MMPNTCAIDKKEKEDHQYSSKIFREEFFELGHKISPCLPDKGKINQE